MQRRTPQREESWLLSYADLITNLMLFFVVLLSAAQLNKSKMQQIVKNISGEQSAESLESIRAQIDAQIEKMQLKEVVGTSLGDGGLELTLNSAVVFDSGKAKIRPEVETVVASMLGILAPYSSKYNFAVEGHTDSKPVLPGGLYSSNWDLSSARAIEVRARLEANGIERRRIRVEGYADTKPLDEKQIANLSAEEREARHRRVVVRIY
jgi:chemotaxis protein MotB